jgi:hypothetical protein
LAGCLCRAAEEPEPRLQERIKAAFLYKFTTFVEWPLEAFTAPGSPITIGVVGANSIAHELASASAGRMVSGRPIEVRELASRASSATCCHVLFLGKGQAAMSGELLAEARGHPVLTVTDTDAEHPAGSIINFRVIEDHVRFDISRTAAERNGLRLSSQLLSVAHQTEAPR